MQNLGVWELGAVVKVCRSLETPVYAGNHLSLRFLKSETEGTSDLVHYGNQTKECRCNFCASQFIVSMLLNIRQEKLVFDPLIQTKCFILVSNLNYLAIIAMQ